jgi:hypothetical protein
MSESFNKRYRQLGLLTAAILGGELALLVLALVQLQQGLAGLPDFFAIAAGFALVSTVLVVLFLIASLVLTITSWRADRGPVA